MSEKINVIPEADQMSDLDAMIIMAHRNLDIKAAITLIEAKKVKQGGLITFGVDETTLYRFTRQMATGNVSHYAIAYFINKSQLDHIKETEQSTLSLYQQKVRLMQEVIDAGQTFIKTESIVDGIALTGKEEALNTFNEQHKEIK